MKTTTALILAAASVLLLTAFVACQSEPDLSNSTLEIVSGREPNASVSGLVTYGERLALSEGARLIVELRDTSYADAAADLIARQTVSNPGQVPIKFNVGYNRDDIDDRRIYSISARIIESDGRLAFTNDTAYDVITRGNPSKVDMMLVLVEPPPELVNAGGDWRTWVETPVRVISASLIPNEPELFLRVYYYQSTIEGCARPGNEELEVVGNEIRARVTLMQPPPTAWAIPCDEVVVELDAVLPIREALKPGETYRVMLDEVATTTFTLPEARLGHTTIGEALIESVEVIASEGTPTQYELRVVSGMPKGSGCSQFNGYEIRRPEGKRIEVLITQHEISDPDVVCIADFPISETIIPLGTDFETGGEYSVRVNSEAEESFTAR